MARGDFKQRVVFEVEDQASGNVEKIEGRFSKLGSFLASKFAITLGDVVGLFKSVAGAAGDVVAAAEAQENAVASLDQSLAALGPQAAGVSQALQDQAAALEATTTFSDEAIIANQALAINLGVGADQAGKLTAAAVELSSATGSSLESSFVNLSRTLNGFRGELGELVPEVATLSVESLKSGAALDVVLDRLGGSAAAKVGTFSGVVAQLGNAWGTLQEKLGAAITENEAIRESLEKLRNVITSKSFIDSIEAIAEGFAKISEKVLSITTAIDPAITALNNFKTKIIELKDSTIEALGPLGTLLSLIGDALVYQATAGARALDNIGTALEFVAEKTGIAADFNEAYNQSTQEGTAATSEYSDKTEKASAAVISRSEAETVAAETTQQVTESTEDATTALLTYEEANRGVRAEADELTRSLERTARAAAQVNASTGGALTARDRRSQADVDAALAAGRTTTMGGTRIRTADGSGSRLVR